MKASLIVPFRDEKGTTRKASWAWLRRRWKALCPDFQLVVGKDEGMPFSKSSAVNEAASRAKGAVFVICDADSFVEPVFVRQAVEIAMERDVLVIPWSASWRLPPIQSEQILALDPAVPNPLTPEVKQACTDFRPGPATAAMCVVMSRSAFYKVGGMDPRFRGWGSEDVAFMLACSTLLGEAKLVIGEAWALWHHRPRTDGGNGFRVWDGDTGNRNRDLMRRYQTAYRNPALMAALCSEHAFDGHPVHQPAVAPPVHFVRELAYGMTRDGDRIVL